MAPIRRRKAGYGEESEGKIAYSSMTSQPPGASQQAASASTSSRSGRLASNQRAWMRSKEAGGKSSATTSWRTTSRLGARDGSEETSVRIRGYHVAALTTARQPAGYRPGPSAEFQAPPRLLDPALLQYPGRLRVERALQQLQPMFLGGHLVAEHPGAVSVRRRALDAPLVVARPPGTSFGFGFHLALPFCGLRSFRLCHTVYASNDPLTVVHRSRSRRQTSMRSPPASNAARAVRTSAYTPVGD